MWARDGDGGLVACGSPRWKDIGRRAVERIREAGDPAIFIALREEVAMRAEAGEMEAGGNRDLPLYGIPQP